MDARRWFTSYPFLLPVIVFTCLVFAGAFMHPLWGDEAETALFARNILKYGIPKGWDGTNIMGIDNGVVLNKDLVNHTSPWAQYYLAAGSFALFGESAFSSRLPFILLSILSVITFYYVAHSITKNKRTAFIADIILCLSVQYILFSYQARYYSLTLFTTLWFCFSVWRLSSQNRWPKIMFIVSGILLFHGNYVVFAGVYLTCLFAQVGYLTFTKQKAAVRGFLIRFFGLSLPVAACTAPWFFIYQPLQNTGQLAAPGSLAVSFQTFWPVLYEALYVYNLNNAFPVLFVLLLMLVVVMKMKRKRSVAPLVFAVSIPVIFLGIMSLFTLITISGTAFVASRYTMVVLPFFALVVAILIEEVYRWRKGVGIIIALVYLTTSLFALAPNSYLWLFLNEAVHPYPTPDIMVAKYLQSHAKDGDTAFVSLDRDHEPLIFYLKNKLKFINRLDNTNLGVLPYDRLKLPQYLYLYLREPDWIILYSHRGNDGTFLTFDYRSAFPRGLPPTVDLARDYDETALPVFFSDMSRPEIELRSFTGIEPEYRDQVFIYHKKAQ